MQRTLFWCLRAVIMGYKPVSWLKTVIEPTKDRVEKSIEPSSKVLLSSNCGKENNNGHCKTFGNKMNTYTETVKPGI